MPNIEIITVIFEPGNAGSYYVQPTPSEIVDLLTATPCFGYTADNVNDPVTLNEEDWELLNKAEPVSENIEDTYLFHCGGCLARGCKRENTHECDDPDHGNPACMEQCGCQQWKPVLMGKEVPAL